MCVACTTERLEDKGEHVKKVLSEFQALLSVAVNDSGTCRLSDVLNGDKRVLEHLCGLLFGKQKQSGQGFGKNK